MNVCLAALDSLTDLLTIPYTSTILTLSDLTWAIRTHPTTIGMVWLRVGITLLAGVVKTPVAHWALRE